MYEVTPSQAAVINSAAQIGSSALNYAATTNINRKTRKHNEKMYERQMADQAAIYEKQKADNLAQWHMQTEYNSPISQMARLREAGLNPNLVYGATAPSGSASSPPTTSHQSASPSPWNPDVPQLDLGQVAGNSINTYYNLKMQQAQYDNVKADNTIKVEQAAAIRADRLLKTLTASQKELDLSLNSVWSAEERKLKNRTLASQYQGQQTNNTIAKLRQDLMTRTFADLVENASLKNEALKSGITSTNVKTSLLDYEKSLNANGITKSDPVYFKLISKFFDTIIKQ